MSTQGSGHRPPTSQSQPMAPCSPTHRPTLHPLPPRSLFPLPLLPYTHPRSSTSRRRRRLTAVEGIIDDLSNDAIRALNTIYLNYPALSSSLAHSSSLRSSGPSPAQRRLHLRVRQAADAYFHSSRLHACGDTPTGMDVPGRPSASLPRSRLPLSSLVIGAPLAPALALDQPRSFHDGAATPLLPTDLSAAYLAFDHVNAVTMFTGNATPTPVFAYDTAAVSIVPLVASTVALPSTLNHVTLLSCLPPGLAMVYTTPSQLLLPSKQVEARQQQANLRPPRVFADRREYILLVHRMLSVGMLSFTTSPLCVNGLFGTPKGDGQTRLILDARPANCYFVDPPSVQLPSPAHLAALHTTSTRPIYAAKLDLSNFYHQLVLPLWLSPYFALPALTPAELGILIQLGVDVTALMGLGPHSTGMVYPCCTTLPMGFSHSVFIAQSVHEHVVYSGDAIDPADNIINVLHPSIDRPLHGLYIDDVFLLGLDKPACDAQYSRLFAAYTTRHLPPHPSKCTAPSTAVTTVLGIDLHPTTGHLALSPSRRHQLVSSTVRLLSHDTVTGRQLSAVVGSWTWPMLLCRPSLAALKHCYRFALMYEDVPHRLWPCVRRELAVLLALAPLLSASLTTTNYNQVFATDASQLAAGVVQAPLSTTWVRHVWPLAGVRECCLLPSDQPAPTPLGYQPAVEHRRATLDVVTMSNVARDTIQSTEWTTIVSSPWQRLAHINELELEAVILALRAVLSTARASPHRAYRVHLITDSSVVYHSLLKGRSSSPALLRLLRRCSALALGGGLSLVLVWVPSALNPADSPSRFLVASTIIQGDVNDG